METNGDCSKFIDQFCKNNSTSSDRHLRRFFEHFDHDRDGALNKEEFHNMVQVLFSNNGTSYAISEKQAMDIFKLMDENSDSLIDDAEFKICWYHWLKQILDPVTALVIVDVQNDFISGSLAIKDCPAGQDGAAVVPVINSLIERCQFDCVTYSLDWHPQNHISFIENVHQRAVHHSSQVPASQAEKLDTVIFEGPPLTEQKLWPSHCVQNSWGSELHEDLKVVDDAVYIHKGTCADIDSYSAFWDNKKVSQTSLADELTRRGVTDVYVVGLAYDVCVGATAMHALEHGFRTVLVEDACRGVSVTDIDKIRDTLLTRGACIVDSQQVEDMVTCRDRRPELGYQAALHVAMARKLIREAKKKRTELTS